MKERPILFSAPMVRALLEGRKTQTRRACRYQYWTHSELHDANKEGILQKLDRNVSSLYGVPGDRLWVKETSIIAPKRFATPDNTCIPDSDGDPRYVQYIASSSDTEAAGWYKLKKTPSIFMPRWAGRITLEVEAIRVERLQSINEEDAESEGVTLASAVRGIMSESGGGYVRGFERLWGSVNGPDSWKTNPWVWVIHFKLITP